MAELLTADSLLALLTLTGLEIVLGIDNVVFLAILVGKLPVEQQGIGRKLGMGLALIVRLGLLFSISWVMGLTEPLFEAFGRGFSGRDLILMGGGAFLIAKATHEIHDKIENSSPEAEAKARQVRAKFAAVIAQIVVIDIIFSLDSVITAVGMAQQIGVMVIAMILAVGVMFFSAEAIGNFVHRHPTIKMLALSFLILIGVMLLVEGTGAHVNKGYIYFAMAFSLGVELLNIKLRKKTRARA